ncbi:TonB-dependent siderophore receptor [Marinoscillum sp. MHG1-6]|uniref:TonB-dependent receptor plug domain-containing protein n=1 Tax=Marinoscillum sp. MHG1-6 TaxID=2959627 RepID=UPI00215707B3|nr:TonB-dependent receptor [Marinoscillum sp. MHG1-6]
MIKITVTPLKTCGLMLLLVLCLVSLKSHAQSNQVRLNVLLNSFEEQTGINLAYDPDLISHFFLDADQVGDTSNLNLETLLKDFPLQLDRVSDEHVIISSKESLFSIQLTDSLDGKSIERQYVTILKNDEVISVGESGENGNYRFTYQPRTGDSLYAFVTGYEYSPFSLDELLSARTPRINLSRTTYFLDHVVVEDYLTRGIDLNPVNQSIGISVKDLPSLPGETDGDIFASLGVLPGLSTPDNRAGSVFIRGSSPDQSLILYDNIPIYHSGYYFGTISPYNPKVIDEVSIYRNGIHPSMGDRVGGAIVLNTSENLTTETKGGVGLNSLYALGYVKTPILNKKIGLAVGARRSYPSSFTSPKLNAITDMVYAASAVSTGIQGVLPYKQSVFYEDYNAKLEIPVSKKSRLSISGIHARNEMSYSFDLDTLKINSESGFTNQGINAQYDWDLSGRVHSSSSITYSDYEAYFEEGDEIQVQNLAVNHLYDLDVNQRFEWNLNRRWKHEWGGGYRQQEVKYRIRTPLRGVDTTANPGEPLEAFEIIKARTISSYFNTIWNGVAGLTVQLGLRGCYYDQLNSINLMPRASLSYDLSPKWMIKGSYGTYAQYLSQVQYLEFSNAGFENRLWSLADKDGLNMIDGDQSMMGFLFNNDHVVFDVEAYRKRTNNVNFSTTKRYNERTTTTAVDYLAYGMDMFLKFKAGEYSDIWMGYTYSRLLMAFDSASNNQYPSKYDQPNKVYVGASYAKGNWSISGGWRTTSGQYAYSAEVRQAEQVFLDARASMPPPPPPPPGSGPPPPPPENPFRGLDKRIDAVHMLDISASYKLPKKERRPFKTTFGLSLLNVFNVDNLTDQAIRSSLDVGGTRDIAVLVDRNAIGFAPNLMITIEW